MRHYIIVKYNETVTDKTALYREIAKLFEGAAAVEGVQGVELFASVTDLPNRHDLMIVLDMEAEALDNWNQSEIHHAWKRDYGKYIAAKTIFDSI